MWEERGKGEKRKKEKNNVTIYREKFVTIMCEDRGKGKKEKRKRKKIMSLSIEKSS